MILADFFQIPCVKQEPVTCFTLSPVSLISGPGKNNLRLVVIVPDEQGYDYKNQNEFKGYNKDILHSDNGFIS